MTEQRPNHFFFGYDNSFPKNICICLLADGNVISPFILLVALYNLTSALKISSRTAMKGSDVPGVMVQLLNFLHIVSEKLI